VGIEQVVSDPAGAPIGSSEPTPKQLAVAPPALVIDGRSFHLEVALWRDFMPTIGAPGDGVSGSKLMASVKLASADGGAVPAHVALERGWVVKGPTEIWRVAFSNESRPTYPSAIERVGREGPKWGPGIDVDVAVRVRVRQGSWLIRAAKVRIERTG
jgi:hypothetical protein